MLSVKQAWCTPIGAGVFNLSIESERAENERLRVYSNERVFPDNPSPEKPLRHVLISGGYDEEDLRTIARAILDALENPNGQCDKNTVLSRL